MLLRQPSRPWRSAQPHATDFNADIMRCVSTAAQLMGTRPVMTAEGSAHHSAQMPRPPSGAMQVPLRHLERSSIAASKQRASSGLKDGTHSPGASHAGCPRSDRHTARSAVTSCVQGGTTRPSVQCMHGGCKAAGGALCVADAACAGGSRRHAHQEEADVGAAVRVLVAAAAIVCNKLVE